MSDYIQVVTTVETPEDARSIAENAVRSRNAACAQIVGPITSVFRWKGGIEEAQEYLCILKTLSTAYRSLEETIRRHHPYEVPEILRLDITGGGQDYLSWMRTEVEAGT